MLSSRPTEGLREWQNEALNTYMQGNPRDFLVSATPGAGKTTFALTLAATLMRHRLIDRVVVVTPTDHLRLQWAEEAAQKSILLDGKLPNGGKLRPQFTGYVTTYAQVAMNPIVHRRRCETSRTLVILDEIHHAGDGLSWGEAVKEAFSPAVRRVALTGTPFRTKPEEKIPFVTYEAVSEEALQCVPDVTYGYRDALKDGVVRPVVFAAYAGRAKWMNSAGDVLTSDLGGDDGAEYERAAWRTALNPKGRWIRHVFSAADARLTDLRNAGTPNAGGLILANDQETARAYASVLKDVTGHTAAVVLSDDPASSKRIRQFTASTDRWLISVRMVSEGVDIPRLGVLVWATTYRTPLFFAQAVGRVVRAKHPSESATIFIPAVRPLLALAAELEEERNDIVRVKTPPQDGVTDVVLEDNRKDASAGESDFSPLDAEAQFAHVLSGGRAVTAPLELTTEESDFLGLPGLLTPEQTALLLAKRDANLRTQSDTAVRNGSMWVSWRDSDDLRREVNQLARRYASRVGITPAKAHTAVRKAIPGPPSAEASTEVLTARRDWLLSRTERH